MKFLTGWIAGLATAWAVLAIWRSLPVLEDDPAVGIPDLGALYDRFDHRP